MSVWYGTDRSILTQEVRSKRAADAQRNVFAYEVDSQRNVFAYEVKDLQGWSIGNWNLIPEPQRRLLLDHLRRAMDTEDGRVELAVWREDVRRGTPIGTNNDFFHFGAGMAIRNILRGALPDCELPPIRQPNGEMGQNWDDFYIGAIHALVTEPLAPVPTDSPAAS